MYAMNIQNDVIGLVLRENCKSKQSDRLYCMTEQMSRHDIPVCWTTQSLPCGDNVITSTVITPTLNTSTVTDSLCNSGAFSNPNAVRNYPFNLKGAWFLSRSRKFFFICSAIVFKAFQRGPTKYYLQIFFLFHVDLINRGFKVDRYPVLLPVWDRV